MRSVFLWTALLALLIPGCYTSRHAVSTGKNALVTAVFQPGALRLPAVPPGRTRRNFSVEDVEFTNAELKGAFVALGIHSVLRSTDNPEGVEDFRVELTRVIKKGTRGEPVDTTRWSKLGSYLISETDSTATIGTSYLSHASERTTRSYVLLISPPFDPGKVKRVLTRFPEVEEVDVFDPGDSVLVPDRVTAVFEKGALVFPAGPDGRFLHRRYHVPLDQVQFTKAPLKEALAALGVQAITKFSVNPDGVEEARLPWTQTIWKRLRGVPADTTLFSHLNLTLLAETDSTYEIGATYVSRQSARATKTYTLHVSPPTTPNQVVGALRGFPGVESVELEYQAGMFHTMSLAPGEILEEVRPGCPDSLAGSGTRGTVSVEIHVTESGEVGVVWVRESNLDRRFQLAAVDAARRWRFTSSRYDGINMLGEWGRVLPFEFDCR